MMARIEMVLRPEIRARMGQGTDGRPRRWREAKNGLDVIDT